MAKRLKKKVENRNHWRGVKILNRMVKVDSLIRYMIEDPRIGKNVPH